MTVWQPVGSAVHHGDPRPNMARSPFRSIPRQCGCKLALHVHVRVVRDVVDHLDDPTTGEGEPRVVFRRYTIGAVIADSQPFSRKGVVPALRAEVAGADGLVVDEQRHRAERLVRLADGLLLEFDADDVLARAGCRAGQLLLGRNAEEVVDEMEPAVLDEHRVPAEARALRHDDAFRVLDELDFREDLERYAQCTGCRRLRYLRRSG